MCPNLCGHRTLEHADTWFISRILIPSCTNATIQTYLSMLHRRQDMWILKNIQISAIDLICTSDFCHRLNQSRIISASQYKKWLQNDMAIHDHHPFTELQHLFRSSAATITSIKDNMFLWVSLLTSSDVKVYYDDREQIGLKSTKKFKDQDEVDCGNLKTSRIGKRSRKIFDKGVRWSTMDNYYIGGGPSLLNHACSMHANVMIDYDAGVVVAIKTIVSDEKLRVDYGEDENVLIETRGVKCNECHHK